MKEIKAEVLIKRPLDEVWALLTEVEKTPLWQQNLSEAHHVRGTRGEVGCQTEYLATFLGTKFRFITEVMELVRPRHLVVKSMNAPFPLEWHWNLDPVAEGTRLTMLLKGDPGHYFKFTQSLVLGVAHRSCQHSLDTLRDILEVQEMAKL